jgi:hypothetical protein
VDTNSKRQITELYQDINAYLGRVPNATFPLKGVIVNGDLTAYGHQPEFEVWKSLADTLTVKLYPALGNHDYENNVKPDPESTDGCANNNCAERMVKYMQAWLDENKASVSADLLHFDVNTNTYIGSMAYSFEIGTVHVVMLQNHPDYSRRITLFPSSKTYDIRPSLDWLERNLRLARALDRAIIVCTHSYDDDDCFRSGPGLTEFRELMTHYGVAVVFAGHIHPEFGLIDTIHGPTIYGDAIDVPVYRTSSASYQRYMLAAIDLAGRNMVLTPRTAEYPSGYTDGQPYNPINLRTRGSNAASGSALAAVPFYKDWMVFYVADDAVAVRVLSVGSAGPATNLNVLTTPYNDPPNHALSTQLAASLSFRPSAPGQQVAPLVRLFYVSKADAHIHMLSFTPTFGAFVDWMNWSDTALGTPAPGSALAAQGGVDGDLGRSQIYYLDAEANVVLAAESGKDNWEYTLVNTRATAAAPAATGSALAVYGSPVQAVFYIGSDNQLHMLHSSGGWQHTTLTGTGAPGPPPASGTPLAAYGSPEEIVFYVAKDNQLHMLHNRGGWLNTTMTGPGAPGPPPASGTALAAYGSPEEVVFYVASDNQLHMLHNSGGWLNTTMTGPGGVTSAAPAPRSPLSVPKVGARAVEAVLYLGTDGHIHELYNSGAWTHFDVTGG